MNSRSLISAFAVLVLLALGPLSATGAEEIPLTPDQAQERLAKVEMFAIGPVSRGAMMSEGEKDFRVLLDAADGDKRFVEVAKNGTLAARCYALAGLREVGTEGQMDAAATPLLKSQEIVQTMEGCIVSETPAATVAKAILDGKHDGWLQATGVKAEN